MASPIAHTMIGLSLFLWQSKKPESVATVHHRFPLQAAIFVLMANLPDIDFLISWLITGDPNRYHSGLTHSLPWAIMSAVLIASCWQTGPCRWKSGLIALAAVGSHSGVDFFTGPALGFSRSYGVPWFAPFSFERFRSPISLLVGPEHQDMAHVVSLHNWVWASFEVVTLTPVVWLLYRRQKRRFKN